MANRATKKETFRQVLGGWVCKKCKTFYSESEEQARECCNTEDEVLTTWATPWPLFLLLDAHFKFTLDAFASAENTKCEKFYTEEEDALKQDWTGEVVFCNPPYGKALKTCIKKGAESSALSVWLIPPRTDTAWWHEYVSKATEIWFLKGRVPFIDPTSGRRNSPLDPSCIVVFNGYSPVWNKNSDLYVPMIKFWDWRNEIPDMDVERAEEHHADIAYEKFLRWMQG